MNNHLTRWGIIGCGAVTEVKSGPAYQQVPGFSLQGVMRRNVRQAEDYASRHGVERFFDDADALIADPSIDAVYIATPPDSHKEYGLKVAAAGKPCCIEKPLSPGYSDSLEIFQAFSEANIPLFVAYYRRSLPRFLKIKELLDTGAIGAARHISWHLCKAPSDWDLRGVENWRTDSKVAPGGYFDDLASHGLDLFAFLLGEFAEACGVGVNQQGLYTSLDAISACWQHRSGVTGSGCWNFGSRHKEDKVVIYGSRGELAFSVFEEQPIVVHTPQHQQEIWLENPKHVQFYHVQNMRDALHQGVSHPSCGRSALHTSWVMDKILGKI
ncbi:gfo/Idh/MocA family oxidoreductase [Alteromonas aestuariivivens]|uniref:Gfo/Idh/MocA family oxidoreductase n=1 Tax=Alteromonas aestuariivivens TaxID=1938339 RepID=A0A3D8M7E7_9ALTE|nr:Gfo/Idh/MocA family oxidoreductase [Alteromonas aestuariivivens]RDV25682.1 gfo/Idh/MocA family oxidoreductase [Alteromonas aestuariivivens]